MILSLKPDVLDTVIFYGQDIAGLAQLARSDVSLDMSIISQKQLRKTSWGHGQTSYESEKSRTKSFKGSNSMHLAKIGRGIGEWVSNNVLKDIQRLISITTARLSVLKRSIWSRVTRDIQKFYRILWEKRLILNSQELSDLFRPTNPYDTLIDVRAWIVKDDKLCLVKGQEETWALLRL